MTSKQIAGLIPAEYRKEMLEMDLIANAQPVNTCTTMHYLTTIWKNYIEPDFVEGCNLCYARVLDNYKNMLQDLVALEKESNLIEGI